MRAAPPPGRSEQLSCGLGVHPRQPLLPWLLLMHCWEHWELPLAAAGDAGDRLGGDHAEHLPHVRHSQQAHDQLRLTAGSLLQRGCWRGSAEQRPGEGMQHLLPNLGETVTVWMLILTWTRT